jgi:hypothetical protein
MAESSIWAAAYSAEAVPAMVPIRLSQPRVVSREKRGRGGGRVLTSDPGYDGDMFRGAKVLESKVHTACWEVSDGLISINLYVPDVGYEDDISAMDKARARAPAPPISQHQTTEAAPPAMRG